MEQEEEALSQQLHRDILSEYARWWVIFKILVSTLLMLGGASALFSLSNRFVWAVFVVGSLSVLLGLGVLVHACLAPREERHTAAARERERQFSSRLRAITNGRTPAGDS